MRNEQEFNVRPKIERKHDERIETRAARLTGGLEAQLLISHGKVAPPHSGTSRLTKGQKFERTSKEGSGGQVKAQYGKKTSKTKR